MKIIFLNIWHGQRKAELSAFIRREAPTTDIFCFQEAEPDVRQDLQQVLPDFTEYSYDKYPESGFGFSLATYVRNDKPVTQIRKLLEHTPDTGAALVTSIQHGDDIVMIANVHGVTSRVDDKLDTKGRLVQSDTIIGAFHDSKQPVIVGGDFNLLPEADSIRAFAGAGYQDLIAKHHIRTTRNRLAWERYPDNIQYYADYAFTSVGVQIQSFAVPELEVSDHLPLILEFDTRGTKEYHQTHADTGQLEPVA